jgi:membrane dipeptidase
VRVFQPIAAPGGPLGGGAHPGDDRGLSDLGRAFLSRMAELARAAGPGPRPILDLAGMNPATMADSLRWYAEDPANRETLPIMMSQAAFDDPPLNDDSTPSSRIVRELRSLGCVIGLTPGLPGIATPDDLKRFIDAIAAIPFLGQSGHAGIAIASDLMRVERAVPGLGSARDIVRWLVQAFDRPTAARIAADHARDLLLRSIGGAAAGSAT